MKKTIPFLLIVCLPLLAISQKITLQGTVKDSIGNPVETANAIAVNTATQGLDAFGITSSEGRYRLQLKTGETYTIKISYLGLKAEEFTITAGENDITRDITMYEAPNQLDEVEVTYEMPVTVKGDTIVYNSDSFVNGTEKKLEDVLKKLPGVEITEDGEIEVEGKKVTKVMVEGKDFFDGDSKLAAKNIPANALDKVEVLRNYNEVSQMRGLTNNEDNVALNIKLKEGKKNFWFGEVTVGAGLDERYLAHPKLFYYNPKYSINIISDLNNIGELPFTGRDYFNFTGGFRNLNRRGGTSFNVSSSGLGLTLLQNNRARDIDTKFGAANFSFSPKKTWDLSGFAIYSYSKTAIEENRIRRFTEENEMVAGVEEDASTNTLQRSKLGLFKISSSYKPNAKVQFDYDVLLKNSDQGENTSTLSVTSEGADTIDEERRQKPLSLNQNANLYYTLNEKNIFSFEAQHLYQNEDPFYNAIRAEQPFIGTIPTDDLQSNYNINQDQLIKTSKLEAKADYYYVTGPKSNINFTLGTTLSSQNFNSGIFQMLDDASRLDFTDDEFNNDVRFNFTDLYLGFHYKVVSGIFTFNPGFTIHNYRAKNEQLGTSVSDDLFNIVPDIYINMQLKRSESLRFNYSVTRSFTDITKFASGYTFSNYNSLYQGNRDLESALYHNISLNYFSFNMFNYTNVFATLSYNKRIDALKSRSSIEGINQVNSTVNSNFEDDIITASGRFQRTFNKIKASVRSSISYSKLNNVINTERRVSESLTQNYQLSLSTNFREAPNVEVGYNYTTNNYDNGGITSTFYTDRPFVKVDAAFLKGFIFTADYSYYHYKAKDDTVDNEYAFLNANLSYQKKDSKWEYSIKVTNLLNNEDLNRDSFNELFNTTSQYFVQPRYVMLILKYDL